MIERLRPKGQDNVERFNVYFNDYYNDKVFKRYPNIKENVFVVYEDKEYGKDLIFTESGIVSLINGKRPTFTFYDDVKTKGNNLILRDVFNLPTRKYCNPDVGIGEIRGMINAIFFQNTNKINCKNYSVCIENVDKENLGEWFRNLNCSKEDAMIIMYSTKDILEGYHRRVYEGLISKHHLFQFVCSKKDFSLKEYRIVEFKNIETNLQEQLNKKGYIKYQ